MANDRVPRRRRPGELDELLVGVILDAVVGLVTARLTANLLTTVATVAVSTALLVLLRWRGERRWTGDDRQELERLADAVRNKLRSEVGRHRQPDRLTLRVRWSATDGRVLDEVDRILRAGPTAGGAPGRPDRDSTWDDVARVLARLPANRPLLLLGETGGGKTMCALHLVRELLRRRSEGDPVPIYLSIASWNPETRGLYEWVVDGLRRTYPRLGRAARPTGQARRDRSGSTLAFALVSSGRVVLILDGLDEVPRPLRAGALAEINAFVDDEVKVVLTCRSREYAEVGGVRGALRRGAGQLRHAAQAELQPLLPGEIVRYLRFGIPPVRLDRWHGVFDELRDHHDGPLATALRTPLMLWLVDVVYVDGPADPCDLLGFGDADGIARHLLDQLVPATYPQGQVADPELRRFADPYRAQRWLAFLAQHLRHLGTQDLAWWELPRARAAATAVRILSGTFTGIVAATASGLGLGAWSVLMLRERLGVAVTAWTGVVVGAVAGLAVGVPVAVWSARSELPPTDVEIRLRARPRAEVPVRGALAVGVLGFGLVAAVRGVLFGLVVGAVIGTLLVVAYRHTGEVETAEAASPRSILRREQIFVLTYTSTYGLTAGVSGCLVVGPLFGAAFGFACGLCGGLVNGPQYGLTMGYDRMGIVAWSRFLLARLWLAARGLLPLRLMAFLENAHYRDVLRQDGGVYRFRHVELRDRLALAAPRPVPAGRRRRGSP